MWSLGIAICISLFILFPPGELSWPGRSRSPMNETSRECGQQARSKYMACDQNALPVIIWIAQIYFIPDNGTMNNIDFVVNIDRKLSWQSLHSLYWSKQIMAERLPTIMRRIERWNTSQTCWRSYEIVRLPTVLQVLRVLHLDFRLN